MIGVCWDVEGIGGLKLVMVIICLMRFFSNVIFCFRFVFFVLIVIRLLFEVNIIVGDVSVRGEGLIIGLMFIFMFDGGGVMFDKFILLLMIFVGILRLLVKDNMLCFVEVFWVRGCVVGLGVVVVGIGFVDVGGFFFREWFLVFNLIMCFFSYVIWVLWVLCDFWVDLWLWMVYIKRVRMCFIDW